MVARPSLLCKSADGSRLTWVEIWNVKRKSVVARRKGSDDRVAPQSKSRDRTRVRSVAKATSILLLIATERRPMTAREVSERTGIPVPTAYHLMETFIDAEILSKDSRKAYDLGPAVGILADAFHGKLTPPEYLTRPLHELALRTGETVYLSAWRDNDVVILAMLEGTGAVRVIALHSGTRGDAHARAAGKLFLALLPSQALDRYLKAHRLRARTENTITNLIALRRELDTVRARGYAFDCEEFAEGVTGVSSPVMTRDQVIAAYSLAAPSNRFALHRESYIAAVQETANSVSRHAAAAADDSS
jgi:IclR family acetate operon transcriptional repressor